MIGCVVWCPKSTTVLNSRLVGYVLSNAMDCAANFLDFGSWASTTSSRIKWLLAIVCEISTSSSSNGGLGRLAEKAPLPRQSHDS